MTADGATVDRSAVLSDVMNLVNELAGRLGVRRRGHSCRRSSFRTWVWNRSISSCSARAFSTGTASCPLRNIWRNSASVRSKSAM